MSERILIRRPEPGGTLPPGGALRVAFGVDASWESLTARLLVDGEDVTAECALRVAPTHPPSRVELVYVPPGGGWAPGEHEAAVVVNGAEPDAWTFSVS